MTPIEEPSLTSILYRTDNAIEARVLTFPGEYCASVAMGCFVYEKNNSVVFCKDRHSTEAILQCVGSRFGNVFSQAFDDKTPIVAPCECIPRPIDLPDDSVGTKMLELKEQRWRDRYKNKHEHQNDEENGSDESSSVASSPSTMSCWLLEQGVQYYHKRPRETQPQPSSRPIALPSPNKNVEESLRQKIRWAADRSPSGCLDLVALLMLPEVSQRRVVGTDPDWPDYHMHRIPDQRQALTAAETNLLLTKWLAGEHMQKAILYAIIMGLPDCHCGNMAVQEAGDRLRIVHFDTGILSVRAGASLESLQLAYDNEKDGVDYDEDFDFWGGRNGAAYYYPILLSFPAADEPLCEDVRENLLCLEGKQFENIAQSDLLDPELFDEDLHNIGRIFHARLDRMKDFIRENPQGSCKELAFATIEAWKRDFKVNDGSEEFVQWIREIQLWAHTSLER